MKLWIFGCSFSVASDFKNPNLWHYEKNWIDYIYENIKCEEVFNFSQFGVSNEFIFKNLLERSVKFSPGDIVVVQLTNPVRKWFFPEDPILSNITHTNPKSFPDNSYKAIKSYLTNLQNAQCDDIIYTAYVYAIKYLMAVKKDIKFVVLPGWRDYPGVEGNLSGICDREFEDDKSLEIFYNSHHYDPRLNHFSHINHKILSNKILEFLDKRTDRLDLKSGFDTKIYNKDYIGLDNKYCS